ncbi:MAG: hypothetical protein R2875_02760 [Desulfobacterales bacterium]
MRDNPGGLLDQAVKVADVFSGCRHHCQHPGPGGGSRRFL